MRWRTASTCSSEASMPAWFRAGSPGIISSSTKTRTLMATSNGMVMSRRRPNSLSRGEPLPVPRAAPRACLPGGLVPSGRAAWGWTAVSVTVQPTRARR
ncbi:hypothetical protein ACFFX0_21935 [Citricoccus parietis]|uniref:Uncharacterized protein n=1 Tax=Citricoccus parietis TaxID=592307 RepID=A0ABV5G464_9MICC